MPRGQGPEGRVGQVRWGRAWQLPSLLRKATCSGRRRGLPWLEPQGSSHCLEGPGAPSGGCSWRTVPVRAAQEIGALHWRLPQDPRTEKVSSATLGQDQQPVP